MGENPIEIRERQIVYRGFFRIDHYRLRHRLYSGAWSPEISREICDRGNAAGVLLYDPVRDAIVFIEQFRLAAHLAGFPAWQIEIVAGIVDENAADAEIARREAGEEAGLAIIGDLVLIHRFLTSPGGSTETVSLFCGRVDSQDAGGIHGLADEGEDIRVVVKGWEETTKLLSDGGIENGFTLLALYWLAVNRDAIRRRWS